MINPNDIRIGNLVFYSELPGNFDNQKIGEVDLVDIHNTAIGVEGGWFGFANVAPIPLSKEWLERLGFYMEDEEYHAPDHYWFTISEEYIFHAGDPIRDIKIEFIHQLQNLYYSLVGEEIIIKL